MNNFLSISLIACLQLYLIGNADCQISGLSWVFRGTAQQNNTVLTFNMWDTLHLQCRANGINAYQISFVIHKGQAPTGMKNAYPSSGKSGLPPTIQITGGGTLVYSDETGLQQGFENILITTPGGSLLFLSAATYFSRYMNIGVLMPADAGTYHCSAMHSDGGTDAGMFMSSGGVTIVVNTKSGQALASRSHSFTILTYSAALLVSSKLIF